MYVYMLSRSLTHTRHTRTYIHAYTHAYIIHTHTYIYIYVYIQTRTRIYTYKHTHTHIHTHTHSHTYIQTEKLGSGMVGRKRVELLADCFGWKELQQLSLANMTRVYTYVCMYVCVCVCVWHVCIYACMYVHKACWDSWDCLGCRELQQLSLESLTRVYTCVRVFVYVQR